MIDKKIDVMWDDTPVDVSTEVNFIWSIANKLRGTYQSDKYKDVIIPMVIIRRFECALEATKQAVVDQYKKNPAYPAKAMCRVSGYQFFNTSEYTLAELVNDPDHLAANFRNYIEGFSANVQDIIKSLDFDKQIDKMDIDAMVEKNLEKMKEKEAKEGKKDKNRVSSSAMSQYSSMNTRRMKDKSSTAVSADSERKAQQARQTNGKKYKAGSLAAKANMVSSYNETDTRSSKKQGKKG